MDIKISFQNMDHSNPLESHAKEKLGKLESILNVGEKMSPFFVELFLTAKKTHANHSGELHLKTPIYDLHTHEEGHDLYVVVDNVIDKMISLVKKEKTKTRDKNHKSDTEKKVFLDDKYTLGD
jgi:ribosomal subunit interface protein